MSCSGDCANCPMREACGTGGVPDAMREALKDVKDSMESVQYKILVLSGKGGVGKSTVAYLVSKFLSTQFCVGVIDADLCGPSLPILFNTTNETLCQTAYGIQPCAIDGSNIELISTQFFLSNRDDAIIARGPMKNSFILQFLRDVNWGDAQLIVVDTPPGTSDEHLSVVSFMSEAGIDGAIIVTTPEEVAIADVRREIQFCKKSGVKIIGVIENMSSFTCPKCNKESSIYPNTTGGAEKLCQDENLVLLGKIPIDPSMIAGLVGEKYQISKPVADSMSVICQKLIEGLPKKQ
ncbi:Cytosolic Fe-S cluster assembly factor nubp1 [Histomonas meleagridis]|uniref:Cytosolic Fe-S cluster assembly factor nubp1 n=1 Tax=Histomonas meleagridis TaxID=135588 RepID=UPI00355A46A1|nr:Cytosolic Fe-S cluster assembly factor nubp1 [Histomonas meleagridis]KAH0799545.1 Cytosolic Fe-S cluster assembly factor nubp1 [Histomonas meleagridis]